MTIEIRKTKFNTYRADILELAGMPPVGIGNSSEEAVARLFMLIFCGGRDEAVYQEDIRKNRDHIVIHHVDLNNEYVGRY